MSMILHSNQRRLGLDNDWFVETGAMTNDEKVMTEVASKPVLTCVPISNSAAAGSTAPPPSSRAFSRKNRVYVFREFLLRTYGAHLSKGSIVLDVAGGKGDLSWLLTNVDDLDSVVADPRITKHVHIESAITFLRTNPKEALLRSVSNLPTHQPLAALLPKLEGKECFQSPRHLRILVDTFLVDAVRHYLENTNENAWLEYWNDASERSLAAQPLGYREVDLLTSRQITNSMQSLDVILSLKSIIGFHPDQATEACMDLATVLKIPFCVCPCCVFPSEFPNRRSADGERVRTYEDFIPYLQNKYPQMHTGTLDFYEAETARSLVLYTLPNDDC
jgi:hypothetical protein